MAPDLELESRQPFGLLTVFKTVSLPIRISPANLHVVIDCVDALSLVDLLGADPSLTAYEAAFLAVRRQIHASPLLRRGRAPVSSTMSLISRQGMDKTAILRPKGPLGSGRWCCPTVIRVKV